MKFTEFGFEPELLEGLDAMGFEEATPVQTQSIPLIMEGRDILACAQTGTGKTAAFLLPMLNHLTKHESKGINTLIIEPTRELAMQVDQALEGFSYFTPVSSIPIYGGRDGQSMEMEKRALKKGAPIVVATPGRLTSHVDMGYVDFSNITHLILDEADRMLDMGFAPAIMNIVHKLPRTRQTLLFSATMPKEIRKFARQILQPNPAEVNIAISKPAENIMQVVYEVADPGKIPLTQHLLEGKENLDRVIIFASTKKKVRDLAAGLKRVGLNVGEMHSDLNQSDREKSLLAFRNGSLKIVVATDVLSRGIDIKGIDLVINYDCPSDAEDYVHRIGRTARADASGIAITYVDAADRRRLRQIEELIDTRIRRLPLPPDLKDAAPGKGPARGGYRGKGGGRRGGNRRSGGHSKRRPPKKN